MVIDGRAVAAGILVRLKAKPKLSRFLAAVLVGEDSASVSFLKQKEKVARELGVDFRVLNLPADVSQASVQAKIEKLARDGKCGGIILQLPLPAHINCERVITAIPEEKDVDALCGNLVPAPAVGVVEEILRTENYKPRRQGVGAPTETSELTTARVAIVGLGFLVGRPIAKWFEGKAKELITLGIGDDLARLNDADIVILGVGKAGLVGPAMLKHSALVIDFGYSRGADGALRGDFDSSSLVVSRTSLAYTPVPGGTGPILVAKLFENFYTLVALRKE